MSEILVVGSLAYDTISSPSGKADRALGGSANYFSVAAHHFAEVKLVGVVGTDYRDKDMQMLTSRGVDTSGLQTKPGKTFHWEGKYEGDLNEAITVNTELNVFADFNPKLPDSYKKCGYAFLANLDPVIQMSVLEQMDGPKVVGSDTMNFWIDSKRSDLEAVLKKVDLLMINEGESTSLTGTSNAIAACEKLMTMGPKVVVVKRGEYGFVMLSEEGFFLLPAYPITEVVDPTGAGDTFAGAFFGYLAGQDKGLDVETIKDACVYGSVTASFTVQDFSLNKLASVSKEDIETRYKEFRTLVSH